MNETVPLCISAENTNTVIIFKMPTKSFHVYTCYPIKLIQANILFCNIIFKLMFILLLPNTYMLLVSVSNLPNILFTHLQ